MEPEHKLIQDRKNKEKELASWGVELHPYRFDKKDDVATLLATHKDLKAEEHSGVQVTIAGRIVGLRNMGKAAFFHLQDQSGKMQVYIRKEDIEESYKIFKKCDLGDLVGVSGEVFSTKTGEISVHCSAFTFLGKSLLPFPEKFHGLKDQETRYRQRHVDFVVNPEVKEVFFKRAKILRAIRSFLDERAFLEVQTPILQPIYGGGSAKPFVTKINAWDMTMYLRIAYEIYLKKLLVGGFEKVYDLSYCFRNEGADRTHNPEFGMMEIQWMYADYYDVIKLSEELWETVAKTVNGSTKVTLGENEIDLKAPWKQLRVPDAVKAKGYDVESMSDAEVKAALKEHNLTLAGPYSKGAAMMALFEELCEADLIQPTHVMDFPVEVCPLAKPCRDNPKYAERIEAYINGWEVGNSYSELTDSVVLRKNLEAQVKARAGGDDEAHPMDETFLEAVAFGLPPNAGIGIGTDRMVMILTEQESIRDVILFPTMKPRDE